MKFKTKLILQFTFLSICLIISGAYLYYISADKAITTRLNAQLESVGVLKENQINYVLEHHIDHLEEYAHDYAIQSIASYQNSDLNNLVIDSQKYVWEKRLVELSSHEKFLELFIINPSGYVIASTDSYQLGKIKTQENYFLKGINETYLQSYYYDISLQKQGITLATPITTNNSNVIGVLAARIDPELINVIMLERSGLGHTGETYLVNSINLLVTDSLYDANFTYKKSIYTIGVSEALHGNNGFDQYQNYVGKTVVGSFRWIPQLNVCLISEIQTGEAFKELTELFESLIRISIILFVIAIVLIFFITNTMISPLETLTIAARKFGEDKKFNLAPTKIPKDELGDLTKAFQKMIHNINQSREEIENYSQTLEIKVKDRTVELQESKNQLEETIESLQKNKAALLNIMKDLTNTQKELEEKNVELQRANKLKSDFLNVTSHELRTPMSAIKGFVQMLLKEKLGNINSEQQKGLQIILRNTNRLDHLIQDILDISRLESGTMKFLPNPTNISSLTKDVVETMQSFAETKNIKIQLQLEKDLPTLTIDEDRIKQVLINLLNNAVKFSEPNSQIEVNCWLDTDKIMFEVRDYGRGIPKQEKEQVKGLPF